LLSWNLPAKWKPRLSTTSVSFIHDPPPRTRPQAKSGDRGAPPAQPRRRKFAPIWHAAEKVVFSATLEGPGRPRARVGAGIRFLPKQLSLDLSLVEERRFSPGTVFLRYAIRR